MNSETSVGSYDLDDEVIRAIEESDVGGVSECIIEDGFDEELDLMLKLSIKIVQKQENDDSTSVVVEILKHCHIDDVTFALQECNLEPNSRFGMITMLEAILMSNNSKLLQQFVRLPDALKQLSNDSYDELYKHFSPLEELLYLFARSGEKESVEKLVSSNPIIINRKVDQKNDSTSLHAASWGAQYGFFLLLSFLAF